MALIDNELSEPYSIFTYRYFVRQWPQLTWIAYAGDLGDADPATGASEAVGVIVAKADAHRGGPVRGYIAMLTVSPAARGAGVGSELVRRCVGACAAAGCREVALEAEATNAGALRLYGQLGFLRDKRLQRYYLNGNDAYRLKLRLPPPAGGEGEPAPEREAMSEAVAEEALRCLSLGRPDAPNVGA
jgi:peptide alpha-N-acetyltransferase